MDELCQAHRKGYALTHLSRLGSDGTKAGSVRARDRSASVSGGKELMSTDSGAGKFNHAGVS